MKVKLFLLLCVFSSLASASYQNLSLYIDVDGRCPSRAFSAKECAFLSPEFQEVVRHQRKIEMATDDAWINAVYDTALSLVEPIFQMEAIKSEFITGGLLFKGSLENKLKADAQTREFLANDPLGKLQTALVDHWEKIDAAEARGDDITAASLRSTLAAGVTLGVVDLAVGRGKNTLKKGTGIVQEANRVDNAVPMQTTNKPITDPSRLLEYKPNLSLKLPDNLAGTFAGGRYSSRVLNKDITLWKVISFVSKFFN